MTPNPTFDRNAEQRCCSVHVALRVPAPGQRERWSSRRRRGVELNYLGVLDTEEVTG